MYASDTTPQYLNIAVVELDILNHHVYLLEMEVDTVLCVSIAHDRSTSIP